MKPNTDLKMELHATYHVSVLPIDIHGRPGFYNEGLDELVKTNPTIGQLRAAGQRLVYNVTKTAKGYKTAEGYDIQDILVASIEDPIQHQAAGISGVTTQTWIVNTVKAKFKGRVRWHLLPYKVGTILFLSKFDGREFGFARILEIRAARGYEHVEYQMIPAVTGLKIYKVQDIGSNYSYEFQFCKESLITPCFSIDP